jgi:hypothetical protein
MRKRKNACIVLTDFINGCQEINPALKKKRDADKN